MSLLFSALKKMNVSERRDKNVEVLEMGINFFSSDETCL